MKDKSGPKRFKISLLENGIHSLKQGLQAFQQFQNQGNKILLKDAILGIHHGLELLLKEIIARHNEFLIFEDLRQVAKKQQEADLANVNIFFLEKPPRTVGFEEAVLRVQAFIKPPEMDDNLSNSLLSLNRLRNQLEHYAIDVPVDEVTEIIGRLEGSLLIFLRATLGDVRELKEISQARAWGEAKISLTAAEAREARVEQIMKSFSGQTVPGRLFNSSEDILLPSFDKVIRGYSLPKWSIYRADVFGESTEGSWYVEVKKSVGAGDYGVSRVHEVKHVADLALAKPWFVVFDRPSQQVIRASGAIDVFLSSEDEIEELERLLNVPHS